MKDYYKLKYLVTETFYENMLDENYTIGQTAGRCFVEFYTRLSKNNIESVIVASTILARVAAHEPEKLESFLKKYDEILKILEKINLDDYLNEGGKEDILYDIGCVRTCIKKFVKKESL